MGVRPDGPDAPPQVDPPAPSSPGTLNVPPEETQGGDLPASISFGLLERKHVEYDAGYWQLCRALYAGGRAMFRDERTLRALFPPHRNEPPDVYAERVKRAFYIGYPGEIIDYIVSGLMTHPVEIMAEDEMAPYYHDFLEDVSPPGGRRCTVNQLLRHQILTALQCQRAWTQVDFPAVGGEMETEAQQEAAGALDAYAFPVDPESVFDWEEDSAGELSWAKICAETCRRGSPVASPNLITRTYTVYDRSGWARYEVTFDRERPPKPEDAVPLIASGAHSFGRVPLLRLELPDGLWAMSKIEGIARELFNKRCALSWAEYKSLFQERHEFLAAPDPMHGGPAIADDENRAVNQTHGVGWTQERYEKDRVEFVGPDSAPFAHAMASCKNLVEEMHRVTYQMALATDVGSAALRRSGESKKEDKAAHGVVLVGLGEYVRDHAYRVVQTIVEGRGDSHEITASGMSRFETADISAEIANAVELEAVQLPSPTFQRRMKYALAKLKLGDEASEEDLAKIEEELEIAYPLEELRIGDPAGAAEDAIDNDDDDDDDDGKRTVEISEAEVQKALRSANLGRGMSSRPRPPGR